MLLRFHLTYHALCVRSRACACISLYFSLILKLLPINYTCLRRVRVCICGVCAEKFLIDGFPRSVNNYEGYAYASDVLHSTTRDRITFN
jgi:hypothetical protein